MNRIEQAIIDLETTGNTLIPGLSGHDTSELFKLMQMEWLRSHGVTLDKIGGAIAVNLVAAIGQDTATFKSAVDTIAAADDFNDESVKGAVGTILAYMLKATVNLDSDIADPELEGGLEAICDAEYDFLPGLDEFAESVVYDSHLMLKATANTPYFEIYDKWAETHCQFHD